MEQGLKTKYGLPVANADNVFEVLRSVGIVKWKRIGDPVAIADYLKMDLTEEENKDIKYLPQVEVAGFQSPNGELFKGFQFSGMSGVRVFTLIDEFIPVCGEFHHGCEEIILDLPGGHIESEEDYAVCAKREFEEEVGMILEKVIPLGSRGVFIHARRTKAKNFSFLGVTKDPMIFQKQYLDRNERLKVVLVSLDDWLKLIEREFVQSYSVSTTLLALRRLGEFYGD